MTINKKNEKYVKSTTPEANIYSWKLFETAAC